LSLFSIYKKGSLHFGVPFRGGASEMKVKLFTKSEFCDTMILKGTIEVKT